jgi:hypothetical protein
MAARNKSQKSPNRAAQARPKPSRFLVDGMFVAPLEQVDGTTRNLVLPVKIGYRQVQKMLTESRSNIEDLEAFIAEFNLTESAEALDGAADYIEVLALSQIYFDLFNELAAARLGELRGSSTA